MAISILLEPQNFQPVYNEVITVLDSTNKAKTNFEYIIDISVDGVTTSQMKVNSNPEGFGIIDLHRHLEGFVSSDIDIANTDTFQLIPNSFIKYSIALSESYLINVDYTVVNDSGGFARYNCSTAHGLQIGDKIIIANSTDASYNGVQTVTAIPTTLTVTTDRAYSATATGDIQLADGSNTIVPSATVFSADKFATSSVLSWLDVPNFDIDDYKMSIVLRGDLLTSSTENYVKPTNSCFLNFYNDTTDEAKYLKVATDNGTFRILNSFSTSTDVNKFLTVACSPTQLNNTTDTVIVDSGALPMFDSSSISYTIQLTDNVLFSQTSDSYTFNIDNECNSNTNYQIIYQDALGSFIPINFDMVSKRTVSNSKKQYSKNYGSYNSVAASYGWASSERGRTVIDTDITEKIDIQTNWVDDVVSEKVKDLLLSPVVYHLDGANLRAINIKTSSLEVKNKKINKTFNYKIAFEYANKDTRQRG
tara:strand:- start:19699 stop:21129 length:1431 start_codon:yes stop_codon:yes gene_type:complete